MAPCKSNSDAEKRSGGNSKICIEGSPPDNHTTVDNNTQQENAQHKTYDEGIDIILDVEKHIILDIEKRTKVLSHSMCNCCKQIKLNMKTREVYGIRYCQPSFSKKRYEHKD